MATHASAEKRHRQSLKRKERNRSARAAIRTAVKKTFDLLDKGDTAGAKEAAKAATSLLDKAFSHGILHKNNAQRRISRLNTRLNAKPKAPTTGSSKAKASATASKSA